VCVGELQRVLQPGRVRGEVLAVAVGVRAADGGANYEGGCAGELRGFVGRGGRRGGAGRADGREGAGEHR
jgi:hypothetical protein